MKEFDVITIPVSDGSEKEFAIIDIFEMEEKQYVAVSLIVDDTIQDGVYLYRYHVEEDGDVTTEKIISPAEYKRVVKAYEKSGQEDA